MKKYEKDQRFVFNLEISVPILSKDYDEAMLQVINDVNKLNKGDIRILKIEGKEPSIISL